MTARDRVIQRYRQFVALGLSGLGVFLGSVAAMVMLVMVLPDEPRPPNGVDRKFVWSVAVTLGGLAVGLAVALTGIVRLVLVSRCPWCGGNWYMMANQISSGEVVRCPYCERPMDDKLVARGQTGKPLTKGDRYEDELA